MSERALLQRLRTHARERDESERAPMLASQLPLERERLELHAVPAQPDEVSTEGLAMSVRAALWSGDEGYARSQARAAASRLRTLEHAYLNPDLLYLGESLDPTVQLLRTHQERLQADVARDMALVEKASTPGTARMYLYRAHAAVVDALAYLGTDQEFSQIGAIEQRLQALVAAGGEPEYQARLALFELEGWRALSAGRPEAADLVTRYDYLTGDQAESWGWSELPHFKLMLALDRLRQAGIALPAGQLDELVTVPPFIRAAGGWHR